MSKINDKALEALMSLVRQIDSDKAWVTSFSTVENSNENQADTQLDFHITYLRKGDTTNG